MIGKLSKSQFKSIKSLKQKKYRDLESLFLIEGMKLVSEAFSSDVIIEMVLYTNEFDLGIPEGVQAFQVSKKELYAISNLKTPPPVIAVCKYYELKQNDFSKSAIALDGVSDPGNLGTIIRIADWYGIEQIFCGDGTVDMYNPKVIQSSMGSLFRVNLTYQNLDETFSNLPDNYPVFLADMEGDDLYSTKIIEPFLIVMGSESHGLTCKPDKIGFSKISIPRFGGAESLNVAVAAAIILSEFKRPFSD